MSHRYPQSPASQGPDDAYNARYMRVREPVHPEPVEEFFDSQSATRRGRGKAPSKAKQRRRRKRTAVMLVVILLFIGVVFGAALMLRDLLGMNDLKDYPGPGEGSVVFTVEEGAGALAVGTGLEQADIVADSGEFVSALQQISDGREVQPGEYEMRYKMASKDAATILLGEGGAGVSYAAIARDLRQSEVLAILAEATGTDIAEFEALTKDPKQFGLPESARSLEGYLHPGEYRFDLEATPTEIIQEMVGNTFAQLEEDGITDPAEQYKILTIASIVQAEAGEADYASVAGAIMNRLKPDNSETNGLIQSDATVTYGLNRKSYDITPEEKADKGNPYNTYANQGLPVGPIGSPSEEAIDAAVSPADVPFYYWVTVDLDTGETKFSETLEEHSRYVEEYQQWCADNEGRCE